MRGVTQVLTDCPRCKVESALVELIDPSERIGVAIVGNCRLCGYATELGEVTALGQPFVDEEEVVDALRRWAAEEHEPDVEVFALANFNGRDARAVARLVLSGQRVDTGFDVIAWLFPGMHGGGHSDGGAPDRAPPPELRARSKVPPPPEEPTPETPLDPRDVGRALASVMLADGRIRDGERRFLDETLRRLGAPPLDDRDLRVWRPNELGPVPEPDKLLRAMRMLALCDHEADGSERRLLEEYARAWRVTLPGELLPRTGAMAELGRALRALLMT